LQLGTPASIGKAISVLEAAAAASNPNLKDMQAQVLSAIGGLKEGGALADELRLRLNMATGQLQAAARDAVQVARFEQVRGALWMQGLWTQGTSAAGRGRHRGQLVCQTREIRLWAHSS
jgi:hypothetical protein